MHGSKFLEFFKFLIAGVFGGVIGNYIAIVRERNLNSFEVFVNALIIVIVLFVVYGAYLLIVKLEEMRERGKTSRT